MYFLRAVSAIAVVSALAACNANIRWDSLPTSKPTRLTAANADAAGSVPVESFHAHGIAESMRAEKTPDAQPVPYGGQLFSKDWSADGTGLEIAQRNVPGGGTDGSSNIGIDAAASQPTIVRDPWESYNRVMYGFNGKVDKYIARPIGVAYDSVVPDVVQHRVTSFFANLQEPRTFVNQLMQGRPLGAAKTLGRLAINTTVGVGGLFDPASTIALHRTKEDFGQTLGVWGWQDSRYFIVPLQGSATVRDFVGSFGDKPMSPMQYVDNPALSMGLKIVQLGSIRSAALGQEKARAAAPDEYVFVRDAWIQKRRWQIAERQ
jgi:phospholipid-binding lipoprotein MlaA